MLRAEQALQRSAEREAERRERVAGGPPDVCARVLSLHTSAAPRSPPWRFQSHAKCSTAANKARKAQEKAARAEVEQGAAAAQAKATAVRRNVAAKAPVAEAPMSELQKKLLARKA